MKWCGKSAPRRQQWRWQGKPHTEQDQIGEDGPSGPACRLGASQLPGRSLEPCSNARPRGMIALPLFVFDRCSPALPPKEGGRTGHPKPHPSQTRGKDGAPNGEPIGRRSGRQNSAYRPSSYRNCSRGPSPPIRLRSGSLRISAAGLRLPSGPTYRPGSYRKLKTGASSPRFVLCGEGATRFYDEVLRL